MLSNNRFTSASTMKKNQNKQKKRKQRGNKAKEVTSWYDIRDDEPLNTNTKSTQNPTQKVQCQGHWVPGTIPQSVINKMPWGDLDELTNEEFGYWRVSES